MNHLKSATVAGFVVAGLVSLLMPSAMAAPIIQAVGVDTTTSADWRTTTTAKAYDFGGGSGIDNVYGTAGYLTMASKDTSPGTSAINVTSSEVVTGNAATATAGMYAINALPSWVTIAAVDNGFQWKWYNPGNKAFDDPRLVPGASVNDIRTGLAYQPHNVGTYDYFTLTFDENAPAYMRIGILNQGLGTLASMTLSSGTATATQVVEMGRNDTILRYIFFDVAGAANQTLTLGLTASEQDSLGASAIMFDVPEPSCALLLGLGVLVMWRRRGLR